MASHSRSRWFFFPPSVHDEIERHAERLDMSVAHLMRIVWRLARAEVMQLAPRDRAAEQKKPRRRKPRKRKKRPDPNDPRVIAREYAREQAAVDQAVARAALARGSLDSTAAALARRRGRARRAERTVVGKIEAYLLEDGGRPKSVAEAAGAAGADENHAFVVLHRLRMAGLAVRTGPGMYAPAGTSPPAAMPLKYRMLAALARGELPVDELVRRLGGGANVSWLVRRLRWKKLIENRGDGRVALTEAGRARVDELVADLKVGRWIYCYMSGSDDA